MGATSVDWYGSAVIYRAIVAAATVITAISTMAFAYQDLRSDVDSLQEYTRENREMIQMIPRLDERMRRWQEEAISIRAQMENFLKQMIELQHKVLKLQHINTRKLDTLHEEVKNGK